MLRSVNEIEGYGLDVRDGEFGKVHDLLVDDRDWHVRYLVARAGSWLSGRLVLIAPVALGQADWRSHTLRVELTRDEVKAAPPVSEDQPVARQLEHRIVQQFGWPLYWNSAGAAAGALAVPPPAPGRPVATQPVAEEPPADPALRSCREVRGYQVVPESGGEPVGKIHDFIVDDEAWALRYVVVETGGWLHHHRVLLAPAWFADIDWTARRVQAAVSREQIEGSPSYDPHAPVSRDYEGRLHDFYGRPAYWTQGPSVSGKA